MEEAETKWRAALEELATARNEESGIVKRIQELNTGLKKSMAFAQGNERGETPLRAPDVETASQTTQNLPADIHMGSPIGTDFPLLW